MAGIEVTQACRPGGREMYSDWGQAELFQVIRGEGQCAAGEVPVNRVALAGQPAD